MENQDIKEKYCDSCKAYKGVVKVEKLSDKKQFTLECGHPYGEIVVVINETMNIMEKSDYVILKDPVAEIRKAITDSD